MDKDYDFNIKRNVSNQSKVIANTKNKVSSLFSSSCSSPKPEVNYEIIFVISSTPFPSTSHLQTLGRIILGF